MLSNWQVASCHFLQEHFYSPAMTAVISSWSTSHVLKPQHQTCRQPTRCSTLSQQHSYVDSTWQFNSLIQRCHTRLSRLLKRDFCSMRPNSPFISSSTFPSTVNMLPRYKPIQLFPSHFYFLYKLKAEKYCGLLTDFCPRNSHTIPIHVCKNR